MDVGVVGLGAIGRQVCRALDEGIPGLRLAGATARDRAKAERFLKDLRSPAPFLSLDALVEASNLAVEASTQKRGLAGAPWIEQQMIDLDAITQETLIFEGPATEACRAFPANVNVVAALSLAGIGPEKTRIKIFASPERPLNRHRISVEGEFGRLTIEIENVPSENPRTGKLSYLSAIALLKDLTAPLRIG